MLVAYLLLPLFDRALFDIDEREVLQGACSCL
jgi:hypothetical protein